jgi:hypothetical protein
MNEITWYDAGRISGLYDCIKTVRECCHELKLDAWMEEKLVSEIKILAKEADHGKR